MLRILRQPLFYLLPLLILGFFWIIPEKLPIDHVTLTMNGVSEEKVLPVTGIPAHTDFTISFNLELKEGEEPVYTIIPDDCILSIEVNGKIFPQSRIGNLCDYTQGVELDFSEWTKTGSNQLVVKTRNHGGPGGLKVNPVYSGFSSVHFRQVIFSVLLLLVISLILRKFDFSRTAVFLVVLGVAVRLVYSTYTDAFTRVYDVLGHLEYVNIIADESRIPAVGETWSSNHPPLYYLIGAVIKKAAPELLEYLLVQFALLVSFISVAFGVRFLQEIFTRRRFLLLSGLLFVFWPGFVICATRIGNDVPAYLGMFMCFYYAQRWWKSGGAKFMILATLGAALGIMFKSTGFAVAGAWCLIWFLGTLRSFKLGSLKALLLCFLIALVSLVAAQGRTLIAAVKGEKTYIANTTSVNPALRVENALGNYLYFDAREYLTEPYMDTYNDKGGRQYFINTFIKSSLFGEYRVWNALAGVNLALLIALLALPLLALLVFGIFTGNKNLMPAMFFFFILLASLIANRAMYPLSCMQDTRYIMPIVLPMCVFIMHGAAQISHPSLRKSAYTCMGLFSLLSLIFIVGQA